MNGIKPTDELLNRAFDLAYFILGDRTASIYLAMSAMDKLKTASTIQDRRLYYVPTGSAAYPAFRTKVSLSQLHLLQRLIYIEAEPFERLTEGQEKSLHRHDMIIRFIKHLVMITTKHNSFYVALGFCRLLHNYTTIETTEIYNLVIQDPDRGRDDYYYRSRKKHLLHELKDRFGGLLKTYHGYRGEERFKSEEDSGRYASLVQECLLRFMPWESSCVLPADIDPTKDIITPLQFRGRDPDEEHEIELRRIHTLLHPDCFERLAMTLGLDPTSQRLELPHFFTSSDGSGPMTGRLKPQALSQGELEAMRRYLGKNAARRKNTTRRLLSVLVDGDEQACFEVAQSSGVQIFVAEDSEMIEVRSVEQEEEVPLAIHPLTVRGRMKAPTESSVKLGAGQKLSFNVQPVKDSSSEVTSTVINITYQGGKAMRLISSLLGSLNPRPSGRIGSDPSRGLNYPILALCSLLIVVCVAGFLIYLRSRNARPYPQLIAEQTKTMNQAGRSDQPPIDRPSPSSQPAKPEHGAQGGGPRATSSGVPISPRKQKQIPPPGSRQLPGSGSPREIETTRAQGAGTAPTMLLEVKQVYVDSLGETPLSVQVRQMFINDLQSSGRFVVIESRNKADAVFKGSARQMSNGREGVSVALRLVNAKGQVIWSTVSGRRGRTYAGYSAEVTNKITKDLLADIQRLEDQR